MAPLALLKLVPMRAWLNVAIFAALSFGAWFLYDWAHDRGQKSRDPEVTQLKANVQTLLDANATNQDTIQKLKAANKLWSSRAAAKSEEAEAAVASLAVEKKRFDRALSAERKAREKIYARNPNARTWSDAPVPDDIANRLRTEEASDQDSDR